MRPPASRYSPDMSRHAFLGTDAQLRAHNQRIREGAVMAATSDAVTQAARLRRIDELCGCDPQPRARPRRARGVPDRDVRRVARRGTATPDRAGRVRRRGAVVETGATGRTTSCSRRWLRVDSVTAQLLQVHSHALGIVSAAGQRRQRRLLLPDDRRRRQAARVGRQRGQAVGKARRHRSHRARGATRRRLST